MPFEPARTPDPSPVLFSPQHDAADALPEAAAERLRALRQHAVDLHSMLPPSDRLLELGAAKTGARLRLNRLETHRPALEANDPAIADAKRQLDKATADHQRATELYEIRAAKWRTAGTTLHACELFIKTGMPGGTRISAVEDRELSEVLKKGETIVDAVARVQRRVRELKADLHRVSSSCYTKTEAKALVRAAVEQWGANAIDTSVTIEHLSQPTIPTKRVQALVHNVPEAPAAIVFIEIPDMLGIFASVLKDQFTAWLEADVDRNADDGAALSEQQRQEQEAQIGADILSAERQCAALVFAGWRDGLPVEHDATCNPLALLGAELVVVPRAEPISGSSPEWTAIRKGH